jgi:hypothetical protein
VRETGGEKDSQFVICRDIVTIYEKLYHHTVAQKPVNGIDDVDGEQLIYFVPAEGKIYLGRIISRNNKNLFLKIFGSPGGIDAVLDNVKITFHIFRMGDAEYEFVSSVTGHDGSTLNVLIPLEIVRRGETRHPYIDVIIPAQIMPETVQSEKKVSGMPAEAATIREKADSGVERDEMGGENNDDMLSCLIYKINNYEAVLRLPQKLDFNTRYILEFTALEFHFKILTKIIASKTVVGVDIIYYTVKFEEMPESAGKVLKKYVYEHL